MATPAYDLTKEILKLNKELSPKEFEKALHALVTKNLVSNNNNKQAFIITLITEDKEGVALETTKCVFSQKEAGLVFNDFFKDLEDNPNTEVEYVSLEIYKEFNFAKRKDD